ncbi:MAG: hypothetical protein ACREXR_05405 [Gammaproteobacteria bacterium]
MTARAMRWRRGLFRLGVFLAGTALVVSPSLGWYLEALQRRLSASETFEYLLVVVAITPIIVVFGLVKGLAWVIKGFKGR